MLVVDLLHEFELGVWKSILVHLLRIVDSLKGAVLAELDRRWVSSFHIAVSLLKLIMVEDSVRCLHLDRIPFGVSIRTSRSWGDWRLEISKTYYKLVSFSNLLCSMWLVYSVLSPFLQPCCQIPTTYRCYAYCLYFVIGTDLQSCIYTQMRLSIFLNRWQRTFAIAFVASLWTLVQVLKPWSCLAKLRLDDSARINKMWASQAPHLDDSPKGLTFKLISYMP